MEDEREEILPMSPPLAYEVPGGYRVGKIAVSREDEPWFITYAEIIENASGRIAAVTGGHDEEEALLSAAMIVACLNRVPG